MQTHLRWLLLLCVAALLVQPARAYPTSNPQPQPQPADNGLDFDGLGMVIRDPWYDFGTYPGQPAQPNYAAQDRMGEMLEELGVRQVRMEFQIEGGDVVSQVARNDYFINTVAPRHNLQVLGLLGFNLLRGRDVRDLNSTDYINDSIYGGAVNDYMQTWLDRARLIANRYEGNIAAYQTLNEHNRISDHEAIDPVVAARLHTKFYRFFRQVDSQLPGDQSWRDNVKIISGGLHPAGTSSRDDERFVSDEDYLRQVYLSDGFQGYKDTYGAYPIDGLGYHPYPEEIRRTLRSDFLLISARLNTIRNVLEEPEVNHPDLPFWITEIGYNAGYARQTEAGQAAFLEQVVSGLAARDDVETIFWFKYEDFPPASGPFAQKWGVVRIPFEIGSCAGGACYDPWGRPELLRPSFWVYRELAGRGNATPEPPAEIVLDAPDFIDVRDNATYELTATVRRDTATTPITMTWQIDGIEVRQNTGTLTDTFTFEGYPAGTYTLLLEASNAAGIVITEHTIRVGYPIYIPAINT
jgi:hypothetical protein